MYILIFLAAILFRIILFDQNILSTNIITGDSYEYLEIADSIKSYGIYGLDGTKDMNRSPIYPFFIFLINHISNDNLNYIIYTQIVIDAFSCCLIFAIGNKILKFNLSKIFLVILVITCLYTSAYSMMIMTETIYSFLIIFSLYLITKVKQNDQYIYEISLKNNILFSITLVLITLTRPIFSLNIIFFYSLIFFLLIMSKKKFFFLNLKKIFISGIIMLIFISPWLTRNIIVFKDDIFSNRSLATPLGYKTTYNMWKHFYLDEFKAFIKSYEEPFLLFNPLNPPKFAKYVYKDEKIEIEKAFESLRKTKNIFLERSSKQLNYSIETKEAFAKITEKRYLAKPELVFTAPVSRIIKIIFAPKISTFGIDNSGFSASKKKLMIFIIYNFLYVGLGLLFFLQFKNFKKNKLFFIFTLSLIASHIYAYTIWVPNPQSRYLIPLIPIFAILSLKSLENFRDFLFTFKK